MLVWKIVFFKCIFFKSSKCLVEKHNSFTKWFHEAQMFFSLPQGYIPPQRGRQMPLLPLSYLASFLGNLFLSVISSNKLFQHSEPQSFLESRFYGMTWGRSRPTHLNMLAAPTANFWRDHFKLGPPKKKLKNSHSFRKIKSI